MSTYHHGDLPDALRSATAELIAEKGPAGFSLREVARRAGVSHAAPAHHFGDAGGMLTSLAAEGFAILADAMVQAVEGIDDAGERLRRMTTAYRETADRHPGHLAVMSRPELLDGADHDLLMQRGRADAALQRAVTMVRDQRNPSLDVDAATAFCWAVIRGVAGADHVLADRFSAFMVDGLASRKENDPAEATVIEELTLTMPADRIDDYLVRDAEVWTPYLASRDGFLGKETWLPADRPGTVVLIIRWASLDQWKAVSPEDVATVDTRMGHLVPDTLECRSYVVGPSGA